MPSRKSYALLVAIAISIFLLNAWRHGAQVVDDAYIALRYSRHLVEGHGPVYNTGERVEGYTSLGFVLARRPLPEARHPAGRGVGKHVQPRRRGGEPLVVAAAKLERLAQRAVGLRDAGQPTPRLRPLAPLLLLHAPRLRHTGRSGTLESMVYAGCLVCGSRALASREIEAGEASAGSAASPSALALALDAPGGRAALRRRDVRVRARRVAAGTPSSGRGQAEARPALPAPPRG